MTSTCKSNPHQCSHLGSQSSWTNLSRPPVSNRRGLLEIVSTSWMSSWGTPWRINAGMEPRSSPAPLSSANSMSKDEEATEAEVATLAAVPITSIATKPGLDLGAAGTALALGWAPAVSWLYGHSAPRRHNPLGKKMHGPFGLSGSLEPVDSFFGALLGFFLSWDLESFDKLEAGGDCWEPLPLPSPPFPLGFPFPFPLPPWVAATAALGSGETLEGEAGVPSFLGPFRSPSWIEERFFSCCCSAIWRCSLPQRYSNDLSTALLPDSRIRSKTICIDLILFNLSKSHLESIASGGLSVIGSWPKMNCTLSRNETSDAWSPSGLGIWKSSTDDTTPPRAPSKSNSRIIMFSNTLPLSCNPCVIDSSK